MANRFLGFGSTAPTMKFIGATGGATETFNGVNIGEAAEDRLVVAGFTGDGGVSGKTLTGLNLNGVAMNVIGTERDANSGSQYVGLFSMLVPSGATANFVGVGSGINGFGRYGIGVWTITGLRTKPGAVSAPVTATHLQSLPLSIATVDDACIIGVATGTQSAARTWSWSGLDKNFDIDTNGTNSNRLSGAMLQVPSAETPRAISASFSGTASRSSGIVAVFR